MPRKGGRRKKNRTHVTQINPDEDKIPKSFVFKRGKLPMTVQNLVQDMRRVMAPYTADRLKERRSNTMKDFIRIAAPLGVTHFICFTSTDTNINMKICRIPRGPTLFFRVLEYCLIQHIRSSQKRPVDPSLAFKTPPLVVLNNFNSDLDHVKLMNATFQNMFPPIDIQKIVLSECRRVVLFNYDKDNETVEFRHYAILASPIGITKSVKNIIKAKIPNLNKVQDISDYVCGNEYLSESEYEDECSHVVLPDNYRGRGNSKSTQSSIRLVEIGPRFKLKLIKVEREVCEGDILYHSYIKKSVADATKDKIKRQNAINLKQQRREEQEANVQRKNEEKEKKRRRIFEKKTTDYSIESKDAIDEEEADDDDNHYNNDNDNDNDFDNDDV